MLSSQNWAPGHILCLIRSLQRSAIRKVLWNLQEQRFHKTTYLPFIWSLHVAQKIMIKNYNSLSNMHHPHFQMVRVKGATSAWELRECWPRCRRPHRTTASGCSWSVCSAEAMSRVVDLNDRSVLADKNHLIIWYVISPQERDPFFV